MEYHILECIYLVCFQLKSLYTKKEKEKKRVVSKKVVYFFKSCYGKTPLTEQSLYKVIL